MLATKLEAQLRATQPRPYEIFRWSLRESKQFLPLHALPPHPKPLPPTSLGEREASLRQAHDAGPARNFRSRASSQTSTPSSLALSSFEPASLPATTKLVFFDTLPATFAPSASSFSFASSRVSDVSVPVSTTVCPSSGPPLLALRSARV